MKNILKSIYRMIAIWWIDLRTWGLHPLSPYTNRAVLRRNELEHPE